ncbi:hypothetical protein HK100_011805, partial [Physocladia obscura]
MQRRTNILIIFDSSAAVKQAIDLAMRNLAYSPSNTVTIIHIVPQSASQSYQDSTIYSTTKILQSFCSTVHPETQFEIYCTKQEPVCQIEDTINKLLFQTRHRHMGHPQLLILSFARLIPADSTQRYLQKIAVVDGVDVRFTCEDIVPDEDSD